MNSAITEWAIGLHGNEIIDRMMFFFTRLGKWGFVFWFITLGFTLFYLLKKKDKRKAILSGSFLVALGIASLINSLIKIMVKESRPFVEFPQIITFMDSFNYTIPNDYSFPSGHTNASFLAITYFAFVNKYSLIVTLPIGVMISFSRIYIGAHYFVDVMFGAGLGILLGFLLFMFARWCINTLIKDKEVQNEVG